MLLGNKAAVTEVEGPVRDLRLLIEPEPWLRLFLRNIGDLFRAEPAPVWVTSRPGEYWEDALVHRPVAWRSVRQSFLGHTLVILIIYALNLAWLNQPQVLPEAPPNQSVLHYELSEYLPAVNPRKARPEPPRRPRPQKADPEYAPQEIVVVNEKHSSIKQTIVQPSPVFLKQDVPLPNLVASTPAPGAPMAMNHPLQVLPVNTPQIAPPAPQVVESKLRPLMFPPAIQPEVAAPAGATTSRRSIQALPLEGAVVVPPAPDALARKADSLQIPAQSPPTVAPPAPEAASGRALQAMALPVAAPEVAAPAPSAASRNLGNIGLPAQDPTAVPPATAVLNGNAAREKALGQMLVLNARPVAPTGPLTVPEGNRPGEFTASPTGRVGASARPEIKASSDPAAPGQSGGTNSAADIYISAPPAKVKGNTVVASAPAPPPISARPLTPNRTDQPSDRIDTQVFGTRRHYSMRLSMPNLASATGSWSIRFAELNATGQAESDLSAPEAVRKVDPVYPQELIHDRVEGVVVLYAIIRSDGSVSEVRVLEGFDERLNENARQALLQWRFRPGTKNGSPVDVEAVVRVPFKVPRPAF
jgi:TonB family protein